MQSTTYLILLHSTHSIIQSHTARTGRIVLHLLHHIRENINDTYKNQSTATMSVMSSVGRPTDVSTMTIVTSPACGIPAAPMLAAVAVILK